MSAEWNRWIVWDLDDGRRVVAAWSYKSRTAGVQVSGKQVGRWASYDEIPARLDLDPHALTLERVMDDGGLLDWRLWQGETLLLPQPRVLHAARAAAWPMGLFGALDLFMGSRLPAHTNLIGIVEFAGLGGLAVLLAVVLYGSGSRLAAVAGLCVISLRTVSIGIALLVVGDPRMLLTLVIRSVLVMSSVNSTRQLWSRRRAIRDLYPGPSQTHADRPDATNPYSPPDAPTKSVDP